MKTKYLKRIAEALERLVELYDYSLDHPYTTRKPFKVPSSAPSANNKETI